MIDKLVSIMKNRKILIYEDFHNTPYLLLKGKWFKGNWLQNLGFHFHDTVEIKQYKDKLIITKVKDPNLKKI